MHRLWSNEKRDVLIKKTCTECHKTKHIDDFSNYHNGKTKKCKVCIAVQQKKYHDKVVAARLAASTPEIEALHRESLSIERMFLLAERRNNYKRMDKLRRKGLAVLEELHRKVDMSDLIPTEGVSVREREANQESAEENHPM